MGNAGGGGEMATEVGQAALGSSGHWVLLWGHPLAPLTHHGCNRSWGHPGAPVVETQNGLHWEGP